MGESRIRRKAIQVIVITWAGEFRMLMWTLATLPPPPSPCSGGLSKGLLEQGCLMTNLKLFEFSPENYLYVGFC